MSDEELRGGRRFDVELDRSWWVDGLQVVPLDRAVVVRTGEGRLLRLDDEDVHAPPDGATLRT